MRALATGDGPGQVAIPPLCFRTQMMIPSQIFYKFGQCEIGPPVAPGPVIRGAPARVVQKAPALVQQPTVRVQQGVIQAKTLARPKLHKVIPVQCEPGKQHKRGYSCRCVNPDSAARLHTRHTQQAVAAPGTGHRQAGIAGQQGVPAGGARPVSIAQACAWPPRR